MTKVFKSFLAIVVVLALTVTLVGCGFASKAEKLDDYKIHQDPPGINGNLVEGRVYYDAFVLDAKKDGIYAHFTA